ncbi:MAG: Rrf2 family transcriptional regulator [Prolixibacteraceae bacterium]|nr:Rrf2 family transcriptional regulator [Prolixibacteraceae bacterium]
MKFSTKTRYGIRAMIEIASDSSGNGVLQKDIARNQEISNKYLDHIIAALKASNLICNVKGKKSGYILSRPAGEISVYDIHNAFENGICVIDCVGLNVHCENNGSCSAQIFWKGLNNVVLEYFKNTSLQQLLDKKNELQLVS